MHWVNMTVFITHCWRRNGIELGAWLARVLTMALLGLSGAWAQTSSVELAELMPVRKDNALMINAQLKLELGPAVEDALIKGLAVHFAAEAEVFRERWYWTDKKIGVASRYYRLAFQPLTRRWRLNVSSEPISGTGLAGSISQNFETLAEALSVILQVGWFKYTKRRYGEGRRIFLMAPLHHHFEKKGWTETQVVVRFWIITMLLCLIGLASLKLR